MTLLAGALIFLLAFVVTWRATPAIKRRYTAAGRVDSPGGRKQQEAAVPYGAGLSVLFGFSAPIVLGVIAAWIAWDGGPELLQVHAPGIRSKALLMLAILVGSAGMLVMGRLDDKRSISAAKRFCIQLVAAGLVVAAGVRVTLFIASPVIQIAITILWLVFITNATNFIDNMDGLLAGCAISSSLALGAIAGLGGQLFVCAFALALAGSLAGVLPYNRNPAQIYLGDEGSMFVGFLLACLSTLLTYAEPVAQSDIDIRPFIVPLLALTVPVLDGAVVIVARLSRGQAPWTPGLDHLSHRLVGRGLSRAAAVRRLWWVSFVGSAVAVVFQRPTPTAWACGAGLCLLAVVLGRKGGSV